MNRILRHVRKVALLHATHGATDAALLELFLQQQDEAAFEALLRRHGAMVMGVCQRVLRHTQDAEDAFQATFLVLARKAAALRSRDLLASWLYGIALRTALKARAMNRKRRAKESQASMPTEPASEDGVPEELLARLDHEIGRLPERYRAAVVLCELEGKSRKEVAALLGLPEGTLSSRLAYARKLLAQRLGTSVALCGGVLTGVLAQDVSAAMSRSLLRTTARAALQVVSKQVMQTGLVSAQVLTLTDGVIKAMFLSKLKGVGVLFLVLALGVGGLSYRQALAQSGGPVGPASANRTTADEIEELRMEVAALRKGLEITRQRVKLLEQKLNAGGQPGARGAVPRSNSLPMPLPGQTTPAAGTAPAQAETSPVNPFGSVPQPAGAGTNSTGGIQGSLSIPAGGTPVAPAAAPRPAGTGAPISIPPAGASMPQPAQRTIAQPDARPGPQPADKAPAGITLPSVSPPAQTSAGQPVPVARKFFEPRSVERPAQRR